MQLNILWNNNSGSEVAKRYASLLPDNLSLKVATQTDKAVELIDWTNILVSGNPDESLLDGENLSHIIVPYVGIAKELRKRLLDRPHLKLHNSHFNDSFVAQHAVAMLLACSNLIVPGDRQIKKGNWLWGKENKSKSLESKNCLLLGYGAIAKKIEPSIRALGMNILIVKRKYQPVEDAEVMTTQDLNLALEQADVIMVSLPGTSETINLLNAEAFEHMKKDAILVNVGRGNVIDQYALYKALRNKEIFAAGIDVLWNYPRKDELCLPSDATLYELDNIIMSSHRASHIHKWEYFAFKDVIETLEAIAIGKDRNLVDVNLGY